MNLPGSARRWRGMFARILRAVLCTLWLTAIAARADLIEYEGSSTIGRFISDAAVVYDGASFVVSTLSESIGGELCAVRRSCDIGGVANEVAMKWLANGVFKTLIGHDAIAVIVNSTNPIADLSSGQIEGIFSGRIKNWSEVGGPQLPIKTYIVGEASATRSVFRDKIMGRADYAGATVVEPDFAMISKVAGDPRAVGHLSLSFLAFKPGLKPVRVDGEDATVANTAYPIRRPLHLVTHGTPQGKVKAFIDWVLSDEGQAVVKARFLGVTE